MTEPSKSQVSAQRLPAPGSANEAPRRFDATPHRSLKAQESLNWAHCERSFETLLETTFLPLLENGQRVAGGHPVAPFKSAHPLAFPNDR